MLATMQMALFQPPLVFLLLNRWLASSRQEIKSSSTPHYIPNSPLWIPRRGSETRSVGNASLVWKTTRKPKKWRLSKSKTELKWATAHVTLESVHCDPWKPHEYPNCPQSRKSTSIKISSAQSIPRKWEASWYHLTSVKDTSWLMHLGLRSSSPMMNRLFLHTG